MRMLSMEGFLLVWAIGWAIGALLLPIFLKLKAMDNNLRAQSAPARSAWATQHGRAGMLVTMFFIWPALVPLALFKLVIFAVKVVWCILTLLPEAIRQDQQNRQEQ